MDLQELANLAAKKVNEGRAFMQLVLPQRLKQHEHYYLAGRNSPKGRSSGPIKGGEFVNFDPVDVLAWCVAKGADVIVVMPDGSSTNASDLLKEIKGDNDGQED